MKIITQVITIYLVTCILNANSSKKDFSNAFIEVANKGNPSVVSIVSENNIQNNFEYFFHPFNDNPQKNNHKGHSLGSGVIINNERGHIITNNHVIENAEEINVILFDKREMTAEIIATDPSSDIAVIQIDPIQLSSLNIGNSDKLHVGEWIVAIGSPFALHLNHTVTAGIISAVGRNDIISRNNFENFIQHDAAINPGNSGGALFNLEGELIGINTAIATDGFSRANAGVGFAIPINMVMRIMEDLVTDGKVSRGWLGVQIQDINKNIVKNLELKSRNGALISHVIVNSPAENAGIENKDVVIAVDDVQINDASQLKNIISNGRPNENTELTLIRNGIKKNISVKLGIRPNENELEFVENYSNSKFDLLGLNVKTYEINENHLLNSSNSLGVMVMDVKPNSISEENNIHLGDIIMEIGEKMINTVTDYHLELKKYNKGDTIMLRVRRNNIPFYIALEIK